MKSVREQILEQMKGGDPYVAARVCEAVESAFWGTKSLPIESTVTSGAKYTMYDLSEKHKAVITRTVAEDISDPHRRHTFVTKLWLEGDKWKGSTEEIFSPGGADIEKQLLSDAEIDARLAKYGWHREPYREFSEGGAIIRDKKGRNIHFEFNRAGLEAFVLSEKEMQVFKKPREGKGKAKPVDVLRSEQEMTKDPYR